MELAACDVDGQYSDVQKLLKLASSYMGMSCFQSFKTESLSSCLAAWQMWYICGTICMLLRLCIANLGKSCRSFFQQLP